MWGHSEPPLVKETVVLFYLAHQCLFQKLHNGQEKTPPFFFLDEEEPNRNADRIRAH